MAKPDNLEVVNPSEAKPILNQFMPEPDNLEVVDPSEAKPILN